MLIGRPKTHKQFWLLCCGVLSVCLVILTIPLTSAVAQQGTDLLMQRLYRLEQRVQELQLEIRATEESMVNRRGIEPSPGQMQGLPTDVAGRVQVRLLQLESLVEELTGQVEEVGHYLGQLRTQTELLSSDQNYRLAILERAAGISGVTSAPSIVTQRSELLEPAAPMSSMPGISLEVAEARDPIATALEPNTPNLENLSVGGEEPLSSPVAAQPRPVSASVSPTAGTVVSSAPSSDSLIEPSNLFGFVRTDSDGTPLPPAEEAVLERQLQSSVVEPSPPTSIPTPGPISSPVSNESLAVAPGPDPRLIMLPDGTPKEKYDYAFSLLRRADYGRAEAALKMFLEAHPRDALAGNAKYWLGETYYVRGDFEQAAVEFLDGYQNYSKSNKGPDNLLKLGLAMAKLGQLQGACTALSRLSTEYPAASDTILRRAQNERGRLNCS